MLQTVRQWMHAVAGNEAGVSAMEYALIGSLIAIVIIVAVSNIGTSVNEMFASVSFSA